MSKLTKREKGLLYLLFCFLIVMAGFMFLVNPTIEKYNDLNSQYEGMQAKYKMMAGVTQQVENLLKKSDDLDKLINEAMNGFYKVLLVEDIDRTTTNIFVKNGVVPVKLHMNPVSLEPINPYAFAGNQESVVFGTAYICDASFKFHGTQTQFEQILQDIDDAPQMQLMAFTQDEKDPDEKEPDYATVATLTGNDYTVTIRLLMQNIDED